MRTIFSKQSIMYSPLKDITAYEVAKVVEVIDMSASCVDGILLKFIEEHKIQRHFKINGIRWK